jgi:hypothetical protein
MKRFNLLLLLAFAIIVSSCMKDDEQATGTGDAIIVAKKIANNTAYGISLYAYTFSSFKTVTAVSDDGAAKKYTLNANQGYKSNFYYETPDAEFSTTAPEASTFTFSAVFDNGTSQDFQDVLTNKVLPVPEFGDIEFDAVNNAMKINWTEIPAASTYAINILDGQTIVYGSVEIAKTQKSYTLSSTTGGWASGKLPFMGKVYTVRLYAFLYEGERNAYNLQATSIAEAEMTWGE